MIRKEYRDFYQNSIWCVDFFDPLDLTKCVLFNSYGQHMIDTPDGFKVDKGSIGIINFEDPRLIYDTIKVTPDIASQLSYSGQRYISNIFLYNRRATPLASGANMKAYQARLDLLRRIKANSIR